MPVNVTTITVPSNMFTLAGFGCVLLGFSLLLYGSVVLPKLVVLSGALCAGLSVYSTLSTLVIPVYALYGTVLGSTLVGGVLSYKIYSKSMDKLAWATGIFGIYGTYVVTEAVRQNQNALPAFLTRNYSFPIPVSMYTPGVALGVVAMRFLGNKVGFTISAMLMMASSMALYFAAPENLQQLFEMTMSSTKDMYANITWVLVPGYAIAGVAILGLLYLIYSVRALSPNEFVAAAVTAWVGSVLLTQGASMMNLLQRFGVNPFQMIILDSKTIQFNISSFFLKVPVIAYWLMPIGFLFQIPGVYRRAASRVEDNNGVKTEPKL